MTIHFVLMGKGGVGKSLVSSLVAQYLMKLGRDLYCADTDPTNATFHSYASIGAQHIDVSAANMSVDNRKFDQLIERLIEHPGDSVIDTGASSFLPMMEYIQEGRIFSLLGAHGKRTIIHAPLVGGQGLEETIKGLSLFLQFDDVSIVVWENEYFGPVKKEGQPFQQSNYFKAAGDRISGIVRIAARNPATYGHNMAVMTTKRLTFEEAMTLPEFFLMDRQRLCDIQRDVNSQLDKLDL